MEDLQSNNFFVKLQSTYHVLSTQAINNQWSICVPRESSLKRITITENFVKTHILQPSPYFQEQFVTLNGKCVSRKGSLFSTVTGFSEQRTCEIISEETIYSEDLLSYTVFVLSSPLEGSFSRDSLVNTGHFLSVERRSNDQNNTWLKETLGPTVSQFALVSISNFVSEFDNTYVIVLQYISHASKKIHTACDKICEDIVNEYGNTLKDSFINQLKCTIESLIFSQLHNKIISTLQEFHSVADARISQTISNLNLEGISLKDLGVRSVLWCKPYRALLEIKKFTSMTTPLSMLTCIKDAQQYFRKDIDIAISKRSSKIKHKADDLALTTDDTLLLLVYLLIHTRIPHLQSYSEYLRLFHRSLTNTCSELEYHLANFHAAVKFIYNYRNSIFPPRTQRTQSLTHTLLNNSNKIFGSNNINSNLNLNRTTSPYINSNTTAPSPRIPSSPRIVAPVISRQASDPTLKYRSRTLPSGFLKSRLQFFENFKDNFKEKDKNDNLQPKQPVQRKNISDTHRYITANNSQHLKSTTVVSDTHRFITGNNNNNNNNTTNLKHLTIHTRHKSIQNLGKFSHSQTPKDIPITRDISQIGIDLSKDKDLSKNSSSSSNIKNIDKNNEDRLGGFLSKLLTNDDDVICGKL